VLLPLYVGSFIVYFGLWLRERLRNEGAPASLGWMTAGHWSAGPALPWLAALTVIGALSILLYTGSEVMIVKARALWHTNWLPVNLFLTALLASVSAILFLQRWVTGSETRDYRFVLQLFLVSLILAALGALGWAVSGWLLDGVSFNEALRLVQQFGYWQLLFVASSLLGVLLVLATLALLRRPQAMHHAWLLAPVALLAAWSFRWAVLMDVQAVPKYGAGLYPYELPLGSDGLLGIIGTFGLWVAVLIILTSLVAWGGNALNAGNAREVAHG
jgi:tetrathionate reductase subunit C